MVIGTNFGFSSAQAARNTNGTKRIMRGAEQHPCPLQRMHIRALEPPIATSMSADEVAKSAKGEEAAAKVRLLVHRCDRELVFPAQERADRSVCEHPLQLELALVRHAEET